MKLPEFSLTITRNLEFPFPDTKFPYGLGLGLGLIFYLTFLALRLTLFYSTNKENGPLCQNKVTGTSVPRSKVITDQFT